MIWVPFESSRPDLVKKESKVGKVDFLKKTLRLKQSSFYEKISSSLKSDQMACLIYEIVLTLGFKVQIIRSAIIILISFQKIFIKFPEYCFIIFGK